MQKQNLNVLIFDDEQQPTNTQDIKRYTSVNKNTKPSHSNRRKDNGTILNAHNSQKNFKKQSQNNLQSQELLSKEISELNHKIKNLQKQAQRIKIQLKKPSQINNVNSNMNIITNNSQKYKQIEQIIMVVQRKVQIIILESKKIVSKFNQTIQKKLIEISKLNQNHTVKLQAHPIKTQSQTDKFKQKIQHFQLMFRQKLDYYQKFYRNEYEKIIKENKRKQEVMMKKLSQIQLKFINKINVFQTKEKQYIDWIHHLEAKLKQKKSKKMITITQQKPQLTPIPSKSSLVLNNQNGINQTNIQNVPVVQPSKMNCSIDQNNSKMIRKHKIFGQKSTSPVPNNRSNISPTKDSIQSKIGQPKYQQNMMNPSVMQNNFTQNGKNHKYFSKLNSISIQNQHMNGNLNFYAELKRQSTIPTSIDKHIPHRQSQQGWDRFADLNQFSQQYNQSESDDFFTPIDSPQHNGNYERVLANIPLDSREGTYYKLDSKHQKPYQNNFGYQSNTEKVFSPFDLN